MNLSRLFQTVRLWMIPGALKRAEYIKKKGIFAEIGNECSYTDRKIPLYAKLIKIGNNVHFASHVTFITHDVTHMMINRMHIQDLKVEEKVGCIEIGNNVFVGANSTILYNVRIGSNVIIGANSLVTRDIPDNSVVAGVPAHIVGDFHLYLDKRVKETTLHKDYLTPTGERIEAAFQSQCWDDFNKIRMEKLNRKH